MAVVKRPGTEVTREELLAFYEGKTAKWQIPDDVVFVDAIPIGATGKMSRPSCASCSRTTVCQAFEACVTWGFSLVSRVCDSC